MAFVQAGQANTTSAASVGITLTTTAGNTVSIFGTCGPTGTTLSASDNHSQTWTAITGTPIANGAADIKAGMWYNQSITGGSTTYTFACAASNQGPSGVVKEFSGRATSGGPATSANGHDTSAGTSHTLGSITTAAVCDIDVGSGDDAPSSGQTYTAGTGYTTSASMQNPNGANYTCSMGEYQNAAAAGTYQAKFTTGQSVQAAAFVVAWPASGGGGGGTQPQLMMMGVGN